MAADPPDSAQRRRSWGRRIDPVVTTMAAVASLPSVAAAVDALVSGWRPMGDAAIVELRGLDVFSRSHPLLGTAASSSLGGEIANHPGPIAFDIVSVPARFGSGGVALALAAFGVLVTCLSVRVAARAGGRRLAAVVAAAFIWVSWSVGTSTLIDPYNPRSTILVSLGFLAAIPSVLALDRVALAWMLVCGSVVAQVHLGGVLFVAIVVTAIAAIVLVPRRGDRVRLGRAALLVGAPVLVVMWFQPLLEVALHRGDSNLARLLASDTGDGGRNGIRLGTRVASDVLVGPLPIARSTFDKDLFGPWPSPWVAVVSLMLLVALLVAAMLTSWSRSDVVLARAAQASLVAVGAGWFTTMAMPRSVVFGFVLDYLRMLWPIAALSWLTVLAAVVSEVGRRSRPVRVSSPAVIGGVVTAILIGAVAASVPHTASDEQHRADRAVEAADDLGRSVLDRLPAGTVRFVPPPDYDLFGPALLVDLVRAGRAFTVSDPVLVRQYGDRRRVDPDAPLPGLSTVVGVEALARRNDECVVGVGSALERDELDRLDEVVARFAGEVERGRWALGPLGERIVGTTLAPEWLDEVGTPVVRPSDVVLDPAFARLLADDGVVLPGLDEASVRRDAVTLADLDLLLVAATLDCEG